MTAPDRSGPAPSPAGAANGRSAQGRDPARTTAGLPLTTGASRRSADSISWGTMEPPNTRANASPTA